MSYHSEGPPCQGEKLEAGGSEVEVVGPSASQGRSGQQIASEHEVGPSSYPEAGPQQVEGTTLGTQPAGRH